MSLEGGAQVNGEEIHHTEKRQEEVKWRTPKNLNAEVKTPTHPPKKPQRDSRTRFYVAFRTRISSKSNNISFRVKMSHENVLFVF